MWEIFTCGRVPYAAVHVMGLLSELKRGERLEKPDNKACHDDMLAIISILLDMEILLLKCRNNSR